MCPAFAKFPTNFYLFIWLKCTNIIPLHYSFLMAQKSSCFAAAWDLAPCPHSQCLFCYVLLMPTKFSCLAAAWDLAPCPHFHYLPNDLLHHQAGYKKGKVSNFRWLRDGKIGSGILSSSVLGRNICSFLGVPTSFIPSKGLFGSKTVQYKIVN